jgi:fatty-acyl-CoA synthase
MTDPLTLYRLFERGRAIGSGRRVQCLDSGRSVADQSYAQFAQDVVALARALRQRGLEPGQRVATLATNGIRHLQLMWAVPLAGGVFHAINTRLPIDEIAFIIQDANDQILFIDSDLEGLLAGLRKTYPVLDVIYLDEKASAEHASVEALLRSGSATPQAIEEVITDENAPAVLCYTSGTTGRPKGVSYSHRALTLHALTEAMADGYGISHSDNVLLMVPFCHGAGWGVPYSAFMCGAEISVLSGPIRADQVLDILTQQKITFTGAVPEVIARIAPEIALLKANLTGLRILMGGTAPRSEILSILRSAGITSMLCWGMTETLSAATMQHLPPEAGEVPLTQGQPLPLTELSLAESEDGSQELLVRGPCVLDRYHGQSSSARQAGWFATGDTAEIDRNGTLRLQDRRKDLIKSGGEWISPAALEAQISQIVGVEECVVVGVPHPKWGERPLCVAVASETIKIERISQELMSTGRFAKWQLPDDVVALKALPRTMLGKLDRQVLRQTLKNHFQPNPD